MLTTASITVSATSAMLSGPRACAAGEHRQHDRGRRERGVGRAAEML